ncbi:MAG TPA: SDR family NAD(P)-dependent oxidoreductase, partial [Chloroflexota bacterium]|nr:SDR family NAD(P)-dependent oxidoreductase [Chloroflexota bacterium]
MSDLVSGTALVTGAGSGIGRAIALELASAGATLAVVDLHLSSAEETTRNIKDQGGSAVAIQADVSSEEDARDAVRQAVTVDGSLGILVNAAGILDGYRPVHEVDTEIWKRVLDIHLTGTYLCSRFALEPLSRQPASRIINISSVAGLVGAGGGAAYVTAKHGLIGLTRHMAISYADRGVTVNAICPGPIETNLRANSMEILGPGVPDMMSAGVGANPDAWKAIVPVGRRGTVQEIAALAAFLASESAAYITGAPIVIDGGWT